MLEDPFYEERPQPGSRFWGWTLVAWLCVIAGLALLLAGISGCAMKVEGICAVQPIGQNEQGIAFFRYRCEPEG